MAQVWEVQKFASVTVIGTILEEIFQPEYRSPKSFTGKF